MANKKILIFTLMAFLTTEQVVFAEISNVITIDPGFLQKLQQSTSRNDTTVFQVMATTSTGKKPFTQCFDYSAGSGTPLYTHDPVVSMTVIGCSVGGSQSNWKSTGDLTSSSPGVTVGGDQSFNLQINENNMVNMAPPPTK